MTEARKYWIDSMLKIVSPVFENLAKNELSKNLVYRGPEGRRCCCMLEAFGRSFCGFGPFLDDRECDEEEWALVLKYREMLIKCLDNATNPDAPDAMAFGTEVGLQPLVDAAFLCHGLLRSGAFARSLPQALKEQIIRALIRSRKIIPPNNNWILFQSMVETGIYLLGGDYDRVRVIYGIRSFQQWYCGDGMYGDGKPFDMDYYNSFVIQPMLVDIVLTFSPLIAEVERAKANVLRYAARYSEIQERMINRDGTYPYIGRSITYRFGAFQLLSQAMLEHLASSKLSPAAVRCGLTAVIRRVMEGKIFDEQGWLYIGIYGDQPSLGESYICTGSLYLCSAVFLPLGLPESDPFWSLPDEKWTSLKITDGEDTPMDVHI